jgi:DNA repair protein RadC
MKHTLIRSLWNKERLCIQEEFLAFFFNRSNQLLGYKVISTGTMRNCLIDVKLLVSLTPVSLSEQVIIAHNHPSENLKPSAQDEQITKKIKEALALIDVKLLDYFILIDAGYVSFADEEWL